MAELITVLLISVGLAMDAFAVSVSNAMTVKNLTAKQVLAYPLCFGIFQGVMPLIGFYVGSAFDLRRLTLAGFPLWIEEYFYAKKLTLKK